jgi:PucR C-terminal helix-turn-helix domain
MSAIRPELVDPLVHTVAGPGGEVQLVVRVTVGADGESPTLERRSVVETALAEVPALGSHECQVAAESPDPYLFCAELTRSVGDDDLAEAMASVATLAGCSVALLRPDRSVLAAGEPQQRTRTGAVCPPPRSRRWAANGPQADREIVIESGTRRLGVITFQRPVAEPADTVWRIVHNLLAMALLGRNTRARADAAELQAALFACLSDENRDSPAATAAGQVAYRPAVLSPVLGAAPWSAEVFARLRAQIREQPVLAAGSSARIEDRIVCLYPDPPGSDPRAHAEAWRGVLTAAPALPCRVAVGMPGVRGSGLQESYRTTRWLADLQASPTPGLRVDDVAIVDELGVVAGALGPGWGPRMGHFIRRVLGDLIDNPRFGGAMVDTLHAYLIGGSSPTEAARLLHLSPSSMKYRMRIIRESLGDRLDDHDSAFEIELALRLLKAFKGGAGDAASLRISRVDVPDAS